MYSTTSYRAPPELKAAGSRAIQTQTWRKARTPAGDNKALLGWTEGLWTLGGQIEPNWSYFGSGCNYLFSVFPTITYLHLSFAAAGFSHHFYLGETEGTLKSCVK